MLHAKNIFNEILNNIYELEMGELEIPILFNDITIPTQNDYLCAYFADEHFLTVSYKGKDIDVACDINKLKTKPEYVARCIMYCFAKIIKNLNQKNESKMRKKTITLTETKLRGIIKEAVKNMINESFYGDYKSDEYFSIVDKLAKYIIDEYIDLTIFKYATDLQECDYDDIQNFCGLCAQGEYPEDSEESYNEFSIKEWNARHKYSLSRVGMYFENLVSDNWQDWLSEKETEIINDRHDIASISNKYDLGGGGFEALRDFELDVAKRIADIIKSK